MPPPQRPATAPVQPAAISQWVANLGPQNRKKPAFEMPGHGKGCDYDCGDADQEMDPAIEESFVLRMLPGSDCDYLRKIIDNGELNTDSDVSFEFKAQCKAILKIRKHMYAAVLVDLPCIIEASKTLDKKNIIKTADVSQMLLVKQRIKKEEEIKDIELTAADRHYPDGLTPPMHDIRTKWPRRRHVDIRTMKHLRIEVNKQVENLLKKMREQSASPGFSRTQLHRAKIASPVRTKMRAQKSGPLPTMDQMRMRDSVTMNLPPTARTCMPRTILKCKRNPTSVWFPAVPNTMGRAHAGTEEITTMGVPYCGHSYSTLVADKGHYGTVFSCTGRKEGRGLSHRRHNRRQTRPGTEFEFSYRKPSIVGDTTAWINSFTTWTECSTDGTVFSCAGRKEGRGLSHRHHISCQRRDRVQLHGAKGGEGPFASTPQQSTDEAGHGI
jgi:hypothetical protein